MSLPENTLDPNENLHLFSGFAQQTGVALRDPDGHIEERMDVSSQKDVRDFVPDEYLPVLINTENRLMSLTGISELIGELRKHILELSTLDDRNLKKNGMSDDIIAITPEHSKFLLSEKKTIINKYIASVVRIKLLISAIDSMSDDQRDVYGLTRAQLKNWLSILNEILPNLANNDELEELIEQETNKQSKNNEVSRLKKLLSGERAGNDVTEQKKLKERVIGVLLGNTNVKKQTKVAEDLAREIWEVASVINDIRLIERFKIEQIDLLDIKTQISAIKQEFADKKKKDTESDEEFANRLNDSMLRLIIPIVNATKKLFPHNSDESPTNIAAVLYRNEAVCAGKAQVISSIMELVGLQSTPVFVIQTNNNVDSHAVSKTSILGKRILVADANYDPKKNKNPIIQSTSEILLYTAKKTPQNSNTEATIFKMLEANGEVSFFESDTDAPHKIIANQEIGLNNFNHGNYGGVLAENYQELGLSKEEAMKKAEYHYKKALEINPNHSGTHYNYANLLRNNYQELGLSKEVAIRQAEYHYQESLKINFNYSYTHMNYASLLEYNYQELGLSKEEAMKKAEYHYKEALRDLSNSDAHNNYAALLEYNYQELGLSKEEAMKKAEYHYKKALEINPNYSIAHYNYANLLRDNYQELGLSKEEAMKQAEFHHQESLRDANNKYFLLFVTAYANFLDIYIGNKRKALDYYEKALRLMNDSPHLPKYFTKEMVEILIKALTDSLNSSHVDAEKTSLSKFAMD